MNVLIIGGYYWEIYATSFCNAFRAKGHTVIKFDTDLYFKNKHNLKIVQKRNFLDYLYLVQYKFDIGPIIAKINYDLKKIIDKDKPDLIFIYRDRHVRHSIVDFSKQRGIKVFTYNNDDPFSSDYPKYYWRNYIKTAKKCNHVFVFRETNISQYRNIGIINTSLLRAYFIKERNFHIDKKLIPSTYKSDVTFVGHFENDDRDEYLKKLVESGYDIRIYGANWEHSKHYSFLINKIGAIIPLRKDYNLAINSAKIALVFLSKLNRDTYTRRCFEIPATKTFMLSEYTEDLNNMFIEGREAEYFRNENELLNKVNYYLSHDIEREKIAYNGYKRLIKDGHEVSDRIEEIISKWLSC